MVFCHGANKVQHTGKFIKLLWVLIIKYTLKIARQYDII